MSHTAPYCPLGKASPAFGSFCLGGLAAWCSHSAVKVFIYFKKQERKTYPVVAIALVF